MQNIPEAMPDGLHTPACVRDNPCTRYQIHSCQRLIHKRRSYFSLKTLQRGGYVQPALPGKNALVIIAPSIKGASMKTLLKLSLAATAVITAFGAQAQEFPSKDKTVTLVVPYAAGGPTDRVARDLAEALRKPLGGVSVVVDNAAVQAAPSAPPRLHAPRPMAIPCCSTTSACPPCPRCTASWPSTW